MSGRDITKTVRCKQGQAARLGPWRLDSPDFCLSRGGGLIDTAKRGVIMPSAAVDFWVLADSFCPAPAEPMSTEASTPSQTLLEEIDAQQDQLLDQLDALNTRIERVLKECMLRDLPLQVVS